LLLLFTLLAIVLIASGVFDPSPVGTSRWRLEDRQMMLSSQSRDIIWLEEQVPDSPITIRMTASHKSGEEDIGYGLLLGDEAAYLAVAVSPLGYLSIWESEIQSGHSTDSYLLQWQTWPHVKTNRSPNEIWVDIAGNRASVRVNREWLWEGDITSNTENVGLLGESFADTAVIDFESVELFSKRDE
jgi:hypothetical protein